MLLLQSIYLDQEVILTLEEGAQVIAELPAVLLELLLQVMVAAAAGMVLLGSKV